MIIYAFKYLSVSLRTVLTNLVSFDLFRLILTAVLIASKMYNDTYYTNAYIASVGGVTL